VFWSVRDLDANVDCAKSKQLQDVLADHLEHKFQNKLGNPHESPEHLLQVSHLDINTSLLIKTHQKNWRSIQRNLQTAKLPLVPACSKKSASYKWTITLLCSISFEFSENTLIITDKSIKVVNIMLTEISEK